MRRQTSSKTSKTRSEATGAHVQRNVRACSRFWHRALARRRRIGSLSGCLFFPRWIPVRRNARGTVSRSNARFRCLDRGTSRSRCSATRTRMKALVPRERWRLGQCGAPPTDEATSRTWARPRLASRSRSDSSRGRSRAASRCVGTRRTRETRRQGPRPRSVRNTYAGSFYQPPEGRDGLIRAIRPPRLRAPRHAFAGDHDATRAPRRQSPERA